MIACGESMIVTVYLRDPERYYKLRSGTNQDSERLFPLHNNSTKSIGRLASTLNLDVKPNPISGGEQKTISLGERQK